MPRLWLVKLSIVEYNSCADIFYIQCTEVVFASLLKVIVLNLYLILQLLSRPGQDKDATDEGINLDESETLLGQFKGIDTIDAPPKSSRLYPSPRLCCLLLQCHQLLPQHLALSHLLPQLFIRNNSDRLAELTANISEKIIKVCSQRS